MTVSSRFATSTPPGNDLRNCPEHRNDKNRKLRQRLGRHCRYPGQAANSARAELMRQITALVQKQGWTQVEAAHHSGVTHPRINGLLRGRVSRFSLDALVNIATALGCRVRVDLESA